MNAPPNPHRPSAAPVATPESDGVVPRPRAMVRMHVAVGALALALSALFTVSLISLYLPVFKLGSVV